MAASSAVAAAAPAQWLLAHRSPSTILGEGPTWSVRDQCLYYVDIAGKLLHRYTPPSEAEVAAQGAAGATGDAAREAGGRVDTVAFGSRIGTVALTDRPRHILLAAESGVWLFDWSTLRAVLLAPFPQHDAHNEVDGDKRWRFNDGKASPSGTFVVGTTFNIDEDRGKGLGQVLEYFVSDAGTLAAKVVHKGVTISNGLDWEGERGGAGSMIYIDTPACTVQRFVWDASCSGSASAERSPMRDGQTLIRWPVDEEKNYPDGMTLDAAGELHVACWAGGRVVRYSADGQRRPQSSDLLFPASQTTCCAFGGPKLQDLYVTSASRDIDPAKEPLAGSLFVVRNAGQGRAAFEFDTSKLKIDDSKAVQHKLK